MDRQTCSYYCTYVSPQHAHSRAYKEKQTTSAARSLRAPSSSGLLPALLYHTSLITFLPLFRRTHPSKLKSIPAAEMLSRKPTRLPRSYPDNKATITTARRTAPHKPSILNSRQLAVKTDRIIIPVVECCIGSKEGRSRAGNRKRTCDGGTLKCGRVNVLGHERIWGVVQYTQNFYHSR